MGGVAMVFFIFFSIGVFISTVFLAILYAISQISRKLDSIVSVILKVILGIEVVIVIVWIIHFVFYIKNPMSYDFRHENYIDHAFYFIPIFLLCIVPSIASLIKEKWYFQLLYIFLLLGSVMMFIEIGTLIGINQE